MSKEKLPIMTDAEVAELFRMSKKTLQRKMRIGFAEGETDLNKARPEHIGGRRWWCRADVEKLARIRD